MTRSQLSSPYTGFTLVELLVAIAVLAIIVVAAASILGTTATLTTANNKHMDANDQARMVFDRMADDFARMIKRKDVDYIFWKAGVSASGVPAQTSGQPANDAMYFYTEGASYFDTSTFQTVPAGVTYSEAEKNEISLVGYRVNNTAAVGVAPYYQLERLGKALSCDSAAYNSSAAANNSAQANLMVFLTYPVAGTDVASLDPTFISPSYSNAYFSSTLAGAYSNNANQSFGVLPSAVGTYPGGAAATSTFNDSGDTAYRTIGSQVFRFEYAFQLKDGTLSNIPVMKPNAGTNGIPYSFLSANQRPLPTDDSANDNGDGSFAIGSRWYDATNQIGYVCLDATANYAIWHEIGIQDISAIIVTIAVIDKQGLLYAQKSALNLASIATQLPDYVSTTSTSTVTGDPAYLLDPANKKGWAYPLLPAGAGTKSPLATATSLPQSMVSQIRLYQRHFYLNSF